MAANQGRTQDLKFGYSKFEKAIFFAQLSPFFLIMI
jgi:hypothetical protein